MGKDVLVALIAKDINELQMLTEGIEQMENIPAQYLHLALVKSKSLTHNIECLMGGSDGEGANLAAQAAAGQARQEELMRKAAEEIEKQRNAIAEAEREEAELLAAEEANRIAEEKRLAEQARIQEEARRKAEEEARLEAGRLEAERLAQEQKERERMERERAAEAERLAEQARIQEEEARLEAGRLEAERLAQEQKERERVERERAEAERLAEQARIQEEARRKAEEEQERSAVVDRESAPADAVIPQARVTTVADAISASESVLDKLNHGTDTKTIASSLGMKKIDDIKSAITIVDRFRYQRELFGGDGEKMNRTIADLNSCSDFESAQAYIEKNYPEWGSGSSAVADFVNILQRRFL